MDRISGQLKNESKSALFSEPGDAQWSENRTAIMRFQVRLMIQFRVHLIMHLKLHLKVHFKIYKRCTKRCTAGCTCDWIVYAIFNA